MEQPAREVRSALDRRVVLLIFLLSGFAGLVYEVVWARQLVLVFGNTTQAISAILTGFFGGMAIGSVVGGRVADRVKQPLRLYAFLELAVVVAVLLTPATFRGLHEVYRGVFESLEQSPTALALIRFGLAILALGPATVLMGATLPTLSRWLVRDHNQMGEGFGSLYAANTFGAILGTLCSGLVLIELVGLSTTLAIGAACSGTAGVAAFLLNMRARRQLPVDAPAPAAKAPAAEAPGAAHAVATRDEGVSIARPKLALVVAFVSGLTSLGYQNLWMRVLSSGTGSSSYIFTSILAIFLIGIAVGAFLFSRRLSKTRRPVAILGMAELLLAMVVLATLAVEAGWPARVPFQYQLLIVVAPATLIMGVVFPMSSMLVADSDSKIGSSAGLLLGSNTLGAICGTFVVPFVLMPILTSTRAVVLIAGVNALTGLALLLAEPAMLPRVRRGAGSLAGAVAIAALVLMVVPNSLVADPEVNYLHRVHAAVLDHAEDDVASVVAAQYNRQKSPLQLYVGGYGMTGLTVDTRMMAHVPLMIRPQSKSICVIAFGMGSSYHSAINDGLRVEAVELVPSVPDMFKYFYPDAEKAQNNPNGRILIADGRNHVELTTHKYDLLIVDPPPPMNSSGAAVLYSQEFYRSAKGRLNSGGVMMEWEFLGQTVDELRSHVKTFRSVFPHVTLLFGSALPTTGVMMLGSDDPIELTSANIQSVLSRPGVVEDLSSATDSPVGVTTAAGWEQEILKDVWMSDAKVDQFAAAGTLIDDDRPYTEYDALRHWFGPASTGATKENLLQAMPK